MVRDIAWGLVGFVNLYAWSRWAFRDWEGRPLSWRGTGPELSPNRRYGRMFIGIAGFFATFLLLCHPRGLWGCA